MAHRVAGADASPNDVGNHEEPPARMPGAPARPSVLVRLLPVLVVFLVLLVPCAVIVGAREHESQPLFILDEFPYADDLHKVHDGEPLVPWGELSGHETLRKLACGGFTPDIWPIAQRPPCNAPVVDPGRSRTAA